jgi:hypothetical protein
MESLVTPKNVYLLRINEVLRKDWTWCFLCGVAQAVNFRVISVTKNRRNPIKIKSKSIGLNLRENSMRKVLFLVIGSMISG